MNWVGVVWSSPYQLLAMTAWPPSSATRGSTLAVGIDVTTPYPRAKPMSRCSMNCTSHLLGRGTFGHPGNRHLITANWGPKALLRQDFAPSPQPLTYCPTRPLPWGLETNRNELETGVYSGFWCCAAASSSSPDLLSPCSAALPR